MGTKRNPVACTPEIFEQVLAALYEGVTPAQLVEINKDSGQFPSLSAIYRYCFADNANRQKYAHAREACADALADTVIVAADSTDTDPQRARNRMTGRQWLAAKLRPKVYGDKLDIDLNNKIDVSIAITQARARSQLQSAESPLIDVTPAPVDPFS